MMLHTVNRPNVVVPDPVFVLALPRSFGSMVAGMLGQHPQLYGLPETHLFGCNTVAEWCARASTESFSMADGLLRVIAQLNFGEQTDDAVMQSGAWLRRRVDFTTGFLLEALAERVNPRTLVDGSPSFAFSLESMQRARAMFPLSKFIHLVQHPRSYGEGVMESIRQAAQSGPVPSWMLQLACFPRNVPSDGEASSDREDLDPARAWYALNTRIRDFLESVPESQKMFVHGEDVLADSNEILRTIAEWVGVSTDSAAIEEMKHPERSPYSCLGPPSARYGNDYEFLTRPALTPFPAAPQSLNGALDWRPDGGEFPTGVKDLARRFGYA